MASGESARGVLGLRQAVLGYTALGGTTQESPNAGYRGDQTETAWAASATHAVGDLVAVVGLEPTTRGL